MSTLIENEFNTEQKNNWFLRKEKKFLHNIDTFYYSVSFCNDFLKDTEDENFNTLR